MKALRSRRGGHVPASVGAPQVPAGAVVERFSRGGEEFALISWPVERAALADLPAAQAAVLAGLLDGLSNAEIAAERGTSARTVANQVAKLLRTFGVGSRVELASVVTRPRKQR